MRAQDDTSIMREFEQEIHEITEPKNKLVEWINNYCLMVLGLLMVIGATVLSYLTYQDLSRSLTELAPNPDMAKANIDRISILLSTVGIHMASIWGFLGLGIAFIGIGLAWYTHRSGIRTARIIVAGLGFTSRITIEAISTIRPSSELADKNQ